MEGKIAIFVPKFYYHEKKKVLVTTICENDSYAEVMQKCDVTFSPEGVESFSYDEVLDMIADYDALQSMYNFPVDKRLMDAAPKLKKSSNYAVGYDNIDIAYAATQRDTSNQHTRSANRSLTADQAMGLLLAAIRQSI